MPQTWEQESKHILEELKRLNRNLDKLNETYQNDKLEIWVAITALKIKAGFWGLMGGAITVLPALAYVVIQKH